MNERWPIRALGHDGGFVGIRFYQVIVIRHSGSLLAGIWPSGFLGSAQARHVHAKILDICCANSRMTVFHVDSMRSIRSVPDYRHSGSLLAGSRPSGILGSAQASNVHAKILDICCANSRMTVSRVDSMPPICSVSDYRHSDSLLAGILGVPKLAMYTLRS